MNMHPNFLGLWSAYPKKVNKWSDKWSASKAFSLLVTTESKLDISRLIKCAKIYAQITNPLYYHDLGNWLRDDHWRNIYYSDDLDSILREHEKDLLTIDEIIEYWNANRKRWWLEILDISTKKMIIFDALKDSFFKEKWKDAFDAMLMVFKHRFPEFHRNSNITPNIEWFCKQGIVGRILEGYYGKYRKHNIMRKDQVLRDGVTHVLVEQESELPEQMNVRAELDRLLGRKPKNPFL